MLPASKWILGLTIVLLFLGAGIINRPKWYRVIYGMFAVAYLVGMIGLALYGLFTGQVDMSIANDPMMPLRR